MKTQTSRRRNLVRDSNLYPVHTCRDTKQARVGPQSHVPVVTRHATRTSPRITGADRTTIQECTGYSIAHRDRRSERNHLASASFARRPAPPRGAWWLHLHAPVSLRTVAFRLGRFGQGPRPGHTAHRLTPLTRRLQTQNTHDAGTPETPRALHFRGETCRTSRLASERHVWSVDWRHITEYRWTQSRSTWARRSVGESPCSSSGRSTRPRPCQRGGSAWQRRPCSRGHEVERAAR